MNTFIVETETREFVMNYEFAKAYADLAKVQYLAGCTEEAEETAEIVAKYSEKAKQTFINCPEPCKALMASILASVYKIDVNEAEAK